MAKCYLQDITNPTQEQITPAYWDAFFRFLESDQWYYADEHKQRRMGFVNVMRHNNIIAGYFAHEGQKAGVQYDDNKNLVSPDPFLSFEHIFFAIFEDTVQLLLQSRNIYAYIDLGLPLIRNNFYRVLTDLFKKAGVYIPKGAISVVSAGVSYSQNDLYQIFRSASQVSEIDISNLRYAEFPSEDDEKYILFNPNFEKNKITWTAVANTVEAGLDQIKLIAKDSDSASLQSPIPRAFAGIGEINKVKGHDKNGRIFIRKKTDEADIEIELPANEQINPELIDRIDELLENNGRLESWEDRKRSREQESNNGPLFE